MQPFGGPGEMKFLSQNSKAPKVSQLHRLFPQSYDEIMATL